MWWVCPIGVNAFPNLEGEFEIQGLQCIPRRPNLTVTMGKGFRSKEFTASVHAV